MRIVHSGAKAGVWKARLPPGKRTSCEFLILGVEIADLGVEQEAPDRGPGRLDLDALDVELPALSTLSWAAGRPVTGSRPVSDTRAWKLR